MDAHQREELFTQLRKFADKNSLKYILNSYSSDNTLFLVEMHGDGFLITASYVYNSPEKTDISFYNEASTPTSQETVDELFNDLKSFFGEIPNVTIAEKTSLRMRMDTNQRKEEIFIELFDQMQKFADQHSIEFTVSSHDLDTKTFLVEMDGDGFHITSDAVLSSPTEMDIDFYIEFDNNTPTPTAQKTVDELFNDLKTLLGKYPDVTITKNK